MCRQGCKRREIGISRILSIEPYYRGDFHPESEFLMVHFLLAMTPSESLFSLSLSTSGWVGRWGKGGRGGGGADLAA